MGRNDWIYPATFRAIDVLKKLADRNRVPEGVRWVALNQYIRELLLVQSSDWAYMMWAETTQSYAERRVKEHLDHMDNIQRQFEANSFDIEWLQSVTQKTNFLPNTDLARMYLEILGGR